jgi:adenylate cyclase class IV
MHRPTLREIEIKLRIFDQPALLRQLHQIGARFKGRVFEQNTIYDTTDSAFRRTGRLLRLRLETPAPRIATVRGVPLIRPKRKPYRAVLTTKAPPYRGIRGSASARYKIRLEREMTVRNPARWHRTLHSLGLRPSFIYEKFRSAFELSGLHLELDETPAGAFLELEGSPPAIDHATRELGFKPRDYLRATYWDIHAADCCLRGRPLKNMVFPT